MFARSAAPASPVTVAGSPVTASSPRRATSHRLAGLAARHAAHLAAGLALLASVAGPMVPSAAAFNLPPQLQPKLKSQVASRELTLRVPDLQIGFVAARPETDVVSASRGGPIDVIALTTNAGAGPAGESTTRFALVLEQPPVVSPESPPQEGDVTAGSVSFTLGNVAVPALEGGSGYFPFIEGGAWRFTVPGNTRSGTYHVRACADAAQVVDEMLQSLEANNCRLSDQRVQVSG